MSRQRVLAATAGLLAAVLLGGLLWWMTDREGSYDVGDRSRFAAYCAEVEAQQQGLGEVLATGRRNTGFVDALPAFRQLAAEAPRDIADDWALVITRIEALQTALDDADVDPAVYDAEDPPPGVTARQRQRIAVAAQRLGAEDALVAMGRVSQHARDVCGTPLHL